MKDIDPAAVAPLAVATPSTSAVELDVVPSLPGGHPAWQRDVIAVSARVRAILASLRPIVVRALTFWDHAMRSVAVGSRRLEIDPSGSYRMLSP